MIKLYDFNTYLFNRRQKTFFLLTQNLDGMKRFFYCFFYI